MSALIRQPYRCAFTSPDGCFNSPGGDMWKPEDPVGLASIRTNNNRKTNFRFQYLSGSKPTERIDFQDGNQATEYLNITARMPEKLLKGKHMKIKRCEMISRQ